jgi:hypothetical protein
MSRKPSARWNRGSLAVGSGLFRAWAVDGRYTSDGRPRWGVTDCYSDEERRFAGGSTDTLEAAQLAAERVLETLLSEALAELRGDAAGNVTPVGLRWTTERPTRPGAYLKRTPAGSWAEQVRADESGRLWSRTGIDTEGAEWAGPIPEPT